MTAYRLFELNEFIRRVIALNLGTPLWVRAEIAQLHYSRGHCYLELVEKDGEESTIIAQASGVIWERQDRKLQKQLGLLYRDILQDGMEVLLQVQVDFHERYGLKLIIKDLDPAFTLGKLELQRRQTLKQLQQEGLLDKNKQRALRPVLQRLAVISSETAAGLADFQAQLQENPYGFDFVVHFFQAAMQGDRTEAELTKQLRQINRRYHEFDVVLILRGGGARLDLAAFDSYAIARAVAELPLPVLTGIGHETDETIVDRCAHLSLKTPTAVAGYLIRKNLQFENKLLNLGQELRELGHQRLEQHNREFLLLQQKLASASQQNLQVRNLELQFLEQQLPLIAKQSLHYARVQVQQLNQTLALLRPENAFKRGFSLVLKAGELLRSADQTKPGDRLTITFGDQSKVEAEVRNTKKK